MDAAWENKDRLPEANLRNLIDVLGSMSLSLWITRVTIGSGQRTSACCVTSRMVRGGNGGTASRASKSLAAHLPPHTRSGTQALAERLKVLPLSG